jgi:hypothetical protein
MNPVSDLRVDVMDDEIIVRLPGRTLAGARSWLRWFGRLFLKRGLLIHASSDGWLCSHVSESSSTHRPLASELGLLGASSFRPSRPPT